MEMKHNHSCPSCGVDYECKIENCSVPNDKDVYCTNCYVEELNCG